MKEIGRKIAEKYYKRASYAGVIPDFYFEIVVDPIKTQISFGDIHIENMERRLERSIYG